MFTARPVQRSSISDVSYTSTWYHTATDPNDPLIDLYGVYDADKLSLGVSGPGALYYGNGKNWYTDVLEHHGGANVFIRKSAFKKFLQLSLCPKPHCPNGFQYSIG